MDERPISATGLNYKIFTIIYYLWSSKTYTDKRPLGLTLECEDRVGLSATAFYGLPVDLHSLPAHHH